MSGIGAVGDPGRLDGFRLAGVRVLPARTPDECVAAWDALDGGTAVVILTTAAAAALAGRVAERPSMLTVVMPE